MSDIYDVQIPGVTPGLLPEGFVFRCDHDGCMTRVTEGPTCAAHQGSTRTFATCQEPGCNRESEEGPCEPCEHEAENPDEVA